MSLGSQSHAHLHICQSPLLRIYQCLRRSFRLYVIVQDLDKLECRLWWRAGEPGQKATYRAYCALHSEAQRRKDLELAAEVCIVSPILLFLH